MRRAGTERRRSAHGPAGRYGRTAARSASACGIRRRGAGPRRLPAPTTDKERHGNRSYRDHVHRGGARLLAEHQGDLQRVHRIQGAGRGERRRRGGGGGRRRGDREGDHRVPAQRRRGSRHLGLPAEGLHEGRVRRASPRAARSRASARPTRRSSTARSSSRSAPCRSSCPRAARLASASGR